MKQIWNVSPHGLVLDARKRAVPPAGPTLVEDDVAEHLTAGPDWSYTNPRQKPAGYKQSPPARPVEKE